MSSTEHRGEPGQYTPSCPCVPCEKHRAKNGLSMIGSAEEMRNGGSTELRPSSHAAEAR